MSRSSLLKRAVIIVALLLVTVATVIVAFFTWESVSPFQLPRYTLTNGERRVIFESMAHLASHDFYLDVLADIRQAKREGYVYYYESVRASPDPSTIGELTSVVTGGAVRDLPLPDIQGFIGMIAGLTMQPQTIFLKVENDDDVNADVSAEELLTRLRADVPAVSAPRVATPDDLERARIAYRELSEPAKALLRVLVRNGMSSVLRLSADRIDLGDLHADLIDWRDRVLAEHVTNGPPKIIVTYGAIHFPGMLAELRAHDPRWHVEAVTWRPVFR